MQTSERAQPAPSDRSQHGDAYDVIVIGSGAAALLSAVRVSDTGRRVLVLEKESCFGGNSAMSGGGIWVPNNSGMSAIGLPDSEAEAFAYMRAVIPANQVSDETIRTYIRTAPQMIEYLREVGVPYTPVEKYPDYYPGVEGWKPGGRTMDCAPVEAKELGAAFSHLRAMPPQSKAFNNINLTITEATKIQAVSKGWKTIALGVVARYFTDIAARLSGKRDQRLCMGEALVGRLYLALRERNVELLRNTSVVSLVQDKNRITGVIACDEAGHERQFSARLGVIIAAGGFERSEAMRKAHLANPTSPDWSAGSAGNTGDLIRAGQAVGAATALMGEAWWAPTVRWQGRAIPLFFEKSKPGLVIVDATGRRFMNESITYNSYGKCMYGEDYTVKSRVPAYVIFDSTYRKKYMFGGLLQSSMSPDYMNASAFGENGLLMKAATLRDLAEQLGIDPNGLEETASEMAHFAKTGIDDRFGRGSDEHDRMYGDETVTPNPCLGPIDKGPFYGAQIYPGDIGTKGGLVINNDAQVLDETGEPIAGLYAAGNSSASIMGDVYPGAGCTLGPALTMSFRAANHILRPQRLPKSETSPPTAGEQPASETAVPHEL